MMRVVVLVLVLVLVLAERTRISKALSSDHTSAVCDWSSFGRGEFFCRFFNKRKREPISNVVKNL